MKQKHRVLIAAACLCFLGLVIIQGENLRELRERESGPILTADAPPLMVFTTVVLGGFRGIIADILWLRASLLQEDGRFFELVQLADWITKLEPHFPEVWSFHAWNMAYNVSVMMPEAEDRWRWVQNGFKLLRDEGIRYNPDCPDLFFELAWIFQHKMGGSADTAHMFYRRKWADEMEQLFPSGTIPANGLAPAETRRLADEYGIDVEQVLRIDAQYGPLDWRLPHSHAVYWALQGRLSAGSSVHMSCERVIYQSLAYLTLNGSLSFHANDPESYSTSPNFNLLPKAMAAFQDLLERHPSNALLASYYFFLKDVVISYHRNNMTSEAESLLGTMREIFPPEEEMSSVELFVKFHERQKNAIPR